MDESKHKIISQSSVAVILTGLVVVLGVLACALSPIFVLRTINVNGCRYVQPEEVIRIAGIKTGENLFQLQTDEIRRTLEKDLRIDQAIVQRSFPSQLNIDINERVPLALIKCEYGYLEAGKDGMILNAHRTLQQMPVPMISGVSLADLFVGDVIADENIKKVLTFLSMLQDDSIQLLSEINIANPQDVLLYAGSVQIRLGTLEQLSDKVDVTASVLRELQQTKHPIEYVDARYDVYSVRLRQ